MIQLREERRKYRVKRRNMERDATGRATQKTIWFDCPFCGTEIKARVWSLSGNGKRCECEALFYAGGMTCKSPPPRADLLRGPPTLADEGKEGRPRVILHDASRSRSFMRRRDNSNHLPDAPTATYPLGSRFSHKLLQFTRKSPAAGATNRETHAVDLHHGGHECARSVRIS